MMRVIWLILSLAIAVLAIAAQMDRQARIDPQLSGHVPSPARSFAAAHLVNSAIQSPHPEQALSQARRLAHLRPMEAAHLRMLAQAQLAGPTPKLGEASLRAAGQLGWRDTGTQYGLLRLAMERGDGAEAARRLAAIWALAPDSQPLGPVANAVLARPDAQNEFTRLLASEPRWQARIIREAPAILAPELAQQILPDQ